MNKTKKLSTIVIALALVMCMGYFSVMSPTTAWSYQAQNVSGDKNTFVFADFDVDGDYSFEKKFSFDGATSFKDPDETMFDDAVKVIDVDVSNDGGMIARVYSTVVNEYDTKGLRYFVYTEDMLVDNSVKATIEKNLGGVMTDEALDLYNVGEDGNGGHYIMVNPGEKATIKVALWVEYDESGVETAFEESPWSSIDYKINITMTATEDADGAMAR